MKKRLKQSLGIDVSNDIFGYKEVLNWIKESVDSNVDLLVLMKTTGVYHQGIAHYLYAHGYAVSVMQSGRVKCYALDSRMLSMLGLERILRLWHPPSEE